MRMSERVKDCLLGGACVVSLVSISYLDDVTYPDPMLIIGGIVMVGVVTTITRQLLAVKGDTHEKREE